MTFLWPEMLWLLLIAPALLGAYLWLLRRKKTVALRYASLALVKDAMGRQRFRRHVPPFLFLLALALILFAISRPSAVVTLPSDQRTIMLVMDVSLSMRAMDIQPSRMVAAQAAAKAFVQEQPADVRIGIVSFAGSASLVQRPTHNREDLIAAIDRFELQRHTAIGSGIIVALATLFPDEGIDHDSVPNKYGSYGNGSRGTPIDKPSKPAAKPVQPVLPGSNSSAAIILLTDGRRTTGPDSLEAAKLAADHGVRIFTVGFGTAAGGPVSFDGYSIYMQFDEETLKGIAEKTKGEYFHAANSAELKKIYEGLNARFLFETKETEITALCVSLAMILMLASGMLSLSWFHRTV